MTIFGAHFLIFFAYPLIVVPQCPSKCTCVRSTGYFEATCNSTSFTEITESAKRDSISLNIFNSYVKVIEGNSFCLLPDLECLSIRGPDVEYIDKFAFKNLTKLRKLTIKDTQIEKINSQLFRNLTSLVDLALKQSKISLINSQAFLEMNYLNSLIISNNPLRTIRDKAFATLQILSALDLSYNKLTSLSHDMFYGLTQLTALFLNNNQIRHIGKDPFIHTKKLYFLQISNNKLTRLQNNSINCLNLYNLMLNDNLLTHFNKFALGDSSSLLKLHLERNRISTIEKNNFFPLKNLYRLSLSENRISKIDNQSFSQLHNLITLNLSYNRIEMLPESTFFGMPHLRTLLLSHNYLYSLQDYTNASNCALFTKITRLIHLDLSHNRLKYLNVGTFEFQNNLRQLNLSHNNIKSISRRLFKDLELLAVLDLRYNQLLCTCFYLDILQQLKERTTVHADCIKDGFSIDASKIACNDLRNNWDLQKIDAQNIISIQNSSNYSSSSPVHLNYGDQFIISFSIKLTQKTLLDQTATLQLNLDFDLGNFIYKVDSIVYNSWMSVEIIQRKMNSTYYFSVTKNSEMIFEEILYGKRHLRLIYIDKINGFNLRLSDLVKDVSLYTKGCSFNNGGCMDQCIDDVISYSAICSCLEGVLRKDKKTCSQNPVLFYFAESSFESLDINGDNNQQRTIFNFKNTFGIISAVTQSYGKQQLFYAEISSTNMSSRIWSCDLMNKEIKSVVIVPSVVTVLYHYSGVNRLYFITNNGKLSYISLIPNSIITVLNITISKATSFTVDKCEGLIFISDSIKRQILSFTMNGTAKNVIVTDLIHPTGLVIDQQRGKLYWVDSYYDVIEEANYDGTCRRTVAFIPNTNIISMRLVEGALYWLDTQNDTSTNIWKTNITTGNSMLQFTKHASLNDFEYFEEEQKPKCTFSCNIKEDVLLLEQSLYQIEGIVSKRVEKSNDELQKILLSKDLTFCAGIKSGVLHVSPRGYVLVGKTDQTKELKIAVFESNTSHKFTGDIYITESTDIVLRKKVWHDINENYNMVLYPDWLVLITWFNVGNLKDGTLKNTFQAVIASSTNDTFVILNYGRLDEPFGTVGVNHCNEYLNDDIQVKANTDLMNRTKVIIRVFSTLKREKKSTLLRKILTLIFFILSVVTLSFIAVFIKFIKSRFF